MTRQSSTAILQATLKLIARGGIDAVRYREVAQESGVALGTISYQYPSREELIRSAFKHFLADSESSLCKHAEAVRLREPRDVARLIADILRAEFSGPDRAHLAEFELLVYAARDRQMAEMLGEWDRRLTAELGSILESVGVQTPFATAETLLELSRGFQLVRLGQESPNFNDLRLRIERVLDGLAARGESRTEPFGADSGRMQGAAKRRIPEVFKRAATQQTVPKTPERRRGDFHHGLLSVTAAAPPALRPQRRAEPKRSSPKRSRHE